ncbi:MAG: aldo/keto reductase [Gallionellaceae bacterium]|nr:aldo/keto reductase [Gallionellaceae bacterium]
MILSLGTVQLGLNYGVNNSKGALTDAEAYELLSAAHRAGFAMVDTSSEYGLAEERIGAYLHFHPDAFEVNGKFNAQYPKARIDELIKRTREKVGRLDHVMYYCVDVDVTSLDPEGADGISIYSVAEARAIHLKPYKLVQVPGSILDGRMDAELRVLRALGKRTLVRSLLLQGLLAMPADGALAGNTGNAAFVDAARPYLDGLKAIASGHGMAVIEMAVRWAWYLDPDVAIFGAERPDQAFMIGTYWRRGPLPSAVVDAVLELRQGIPEVVISPRMWGQVYDFSPSREDPK